MSSWATWMGEKRRGRSVYGPQTVGSAWKKKDNTVPVRKVRSEKSSPEVVMPQKSEDISRPQTTESYEENLFDAETNARYSVSAQEEDDTRNSKHIDDVTAGSSTEEERPAAQNGDSDLVSKRHLVAEAVDTPISP